MIELPVISGDPQRKKKPDWLRVKLPVGPDYARVRRVVDQHKLHTICESGNGRMLGRGDSNIYDPR
jgi:lipoic acid synthetase